MKPPKTYLGDGLYADFDGYQIVLSAENGIAILAAVALEPEVFESLLRYAGKIYGVRFKAEPLPGQESDDAGSN